MDLTDKINVHKFYGDNYDIYSNPVDYKDGVKDCLREITPKVAIDFANWVILSKYSDLFHSKIGTFCIDAYSEETYTTEELFQEFLKTYKYE